MQRHHLPALIRLCLVHLWSDVYVDIDGVSETIEGGQAEGADTGKEGARGIERNRARRPSIERRGDV